jgi:hypothetical protein
MPLSELVLMQHAGYCVLDASVLVCFVQHVYYVYLYYI